MVRVPLSSSSQSQLSFEGMDGWTDGGMDDRREGREGREEEGEAGRQENGCNTTLLGIDRGEV